VRILVQYDQLRFINLVSQCFNTNTYAEYVDNIAHYCLDLEIIQYVAFTDTKYTSLIASWFSAYCRHSSTQ